MPTSNVDGRLSCGSLADRIAIQAPIILLVVLGIRGVRLVKLNRGRDVGLQSIPLQIRHPPHVTQPLLGKLETVGTSRRWLVDHLPRLVGNEKVAKLGMVGVNQRFVAVNTDCVVPWVLHLVRRQLGRAVQRAGSSFPTRSIRSSIANCRVGRLSKRVLCGRSRVGRRSGAG